METNYQTESPVCHTITSSLRDDPDYDRITITVRRKTDAKGQPNSFAIERAILSFMADHTPTWVKYCIDTQTKTL